MRLILRSRSTASESSSADTRPTRSAISTTSASKGAVTPAANSEERAARDEVVLEKLMHDLRHVILPGALPHIFTGLQIAMGAAWFSLAAGEIMCLLCDRDITGGGVEVEFFGEVTTLPGGPALAGKMTALN